MDLDLIGQDCFSLIIGQFHRWPQVDQLFEIKPSIGLPAGHSFSIIGPSSGLLVLFNTHKNPTVRIIDLWILLVSNVQPLLIIEATVSSNSIAPLGWNRFFLVVVCETRLLIAKPLCTNMHLKVLWLLLSSWIALVCDPTRLNLFNKNVESSPLFNLFANIFGKVLARSKFLRWTAFNHIKSGNCSICLSSSVYIVKEYTQ